MNSRSSWKYISLELNWWFYLLLFYLSVFLVQSRYGTVWSSNMLMYMSDTKQEEERQSCNSAVIYVSISFYCIIASSLYTICDMSTRKILFCIKTSNLFLFWFTLLLNDPLGFLKVTSYLFIHLLGDKLWLDGSWLTVLFYIYVNLRQMPTNNPGRSWSWQIKNIPAAYLVQCNLSLPWWSRFDSNPWPFAVIPLSPSFLYIFSCHYK